MTVKRNEMAALQAAKTLPSLVEQAQAILRTLAENRGEIPPELEKLMSINKTALAEKLDAYAFIDERMQTEAAFWKAKADAYRKIAQGCEAVRERLRTNIKFAMGELGKTEVKGLEYRFVLVTAKPKVVIADEQALPVNFKLQVTTTVPDKEKIMTALADGFEVPGATLEPVIQLRTYENRSE